MQNVIATVAPVFGLIALGFFLARFAILSETAGKGLSDFVFTVAVPALLFRMMSTTDAGAATPFALWGAYYGASAATWFLATLGTWLLLKRSPLDRSAISMGSSFGNIVMLGIPLALDRFGAEAAIPMTLILSISSPILWFAATLQAELASKQGQLAFGSLLRDLVVSLARNPIILALFAGLAWGQTGLGLHPIPDKMISLLGQAAVPGALVALGLSLNGFEIKGQLPTVALICILSLIVFPSIAWVLAFHVFHLPPLWAGVVVLFAACPPGANAFLFATRYQAAVGSVSAAVALGTTLSILSVSLILWLLEYS